VKEPVVVDSTCLIGLERIGKLDILPELFKPILIPDEVSDEFGALFSWLKVETPGNIGLINALKLSVDYGEAEAIALALERKSKIILDDKQARLIAKRLGLEIIGTIGMFIKAKQNGLIDLLKPVLVDLEKNGFRMSESLRIEALTIAGEK
jgi:predicted nucleic acid-binding protein